jgi:hypothetical protein
VDVTATVEIALELGRAMAQRRTVIVAELFGGPTPIDQLLQSDDPHGLTDCLAYGASLDRVSHRVEVDGSWEVPLSVARAGHDLPGHGALGVDPAGELALVENRQWERLVAGMERNGSTLIIAAPAAFNGIPDLAHRLGIAVGVGGAHGIDFDVLVTVIRDRGAALPVPLPPEDVVERRPAAPRRLRITRRQLGAVAGAAALILSAILLRRDTVARIEASKTGGANAAAAAGVVAQPVGTSSSAASDSGVAILNPADTTIGSIYAVQLSSVNTEQGAILKLRVEVSAVPASTFAPVSINGTKWYGVFAGASTTRSGADSLLVRLRGATPADSSGMMVVRVPYAFRIDSVPVIAAKASVDHLLSMGFPAYALDQGDGTAWILVGAFETAAQSTLYAQSVEGLGVSVTLVVRKGKPL